MPQNIFLSFHFFKQKMFERRESLFASKDIGGMPKKLLLDIVSRDKIFCPEKDLFNFIYIW